MAGNNYAQFLVGIFYGKGNVVETVRCEECVDVSKRKYDYYR